MDELFFSPHYSIFLKRKYRSLKRSRETLKRKIDVSLRAEHSLFSARLSKPLWKTRLSEGRLLGGFSGTFVANSVLIDDKNRMRRFGRLNLKPPELCIPPVNTGYTPQWGRTIAPSGLSHTGLTLGLNVLACALPSRVFQNGDGLMDETERALDNAIIFLKIDPANCCRKK